jgi:hypothetical protein
VVQSSLLLRLLHLMELLFDFSHVPVRILTLRASLAHQLRSVTELARLVLSLFIRCSLASSICSCASIRLLCSLVVKEHHLSLEVLLFISPSLLLNTRIASMGCQQTIWLLAHFDVFILRTEKRSVGLRLAAGGGDAPIIRKSRRQKKYAESFSLIVIVLIAAWKYSRSEVSVTIISEEKKRTYIVQMGFHMYKRQSLLKENY